MGMDPLGKDESYEVVIVLEGPIKKDKFRKFREELYKFLDTCETIDDGMPSQGRKLQVREGRGGVRKNVT
jgi:hypothetical protein